MYSIPYKIRLSLFQTLKETMDTLGPISMVDDDLNDVKLIPAARAGTARN